MLAGPVLTSRPSDSTTLLEVGQSALPLTGNLEIVP